MNNSITVQQFIKSQAVQDRIKELLKDRAPQFVVSLLSAINSNTLLAQCEPQSVLNAAMTAASLDLPINQNLGYAYIIPYNNKKKVVVDGKEITKWVQEAQFQMGWKGFVQLAQRSSKFKTINVSDVKEGELTHIDRLTGEYIFEWKDDRDSLKTIGYVGYIELIEGFKKTMYMSIADLQKHGIKYSKSYQKGFGLWKDNFEAMAHKTLIKLLLAKYAPLSIELQKATMADQAIIEGDSQYTYPDNEPEQPHDVAKQKETARILKHIEGSKTKEELELVLDVLTEETQGAYDEKLKSFS